MPEAGPDLTLVRPLLSVPKSRVIATLAAANVPFAEDPSNRDPRFTRARLRGLMPKLAEEGLNARRLALLAARSGRAEEALRLLADQLYDMLAKQSGGCVEFGSAEFLDSIPDEFALRLLGRAISQLGDEGPVELGKLEALHSALMQAFRARAGFRRSLAGALVTLNRTALTVERAPPRRSRRLTKPAAGRRAIRKKR